MVRIICRIKPPKEDNIEIVSDNTILLSKKSKDLLNQSITKPYQFTLDKFYDYNVKTYDIFNQEIACKIKEKENFSLFIYGHSGSGKTYTLFGNNESRGIFDLLSEKLEYDFKLEALNICHDGNYDLFDSESKKVSIYSDGNNELCYTCKKKDITFDNYEIVKSQILDSRTTGTSRNNSQSSRSHLILKIFKEKKVYTIIDLAGNERKPFFKDKVNELETTFINSSLLALKECFRSYGKAYMPYRRSDLTRFLRNIIESKNNLIISTIHSGFPYFYDSIDTLNYVTSFFERYKQKPNFYNKKILPKIDYSKISKKSKLGSNENLLSSYKMNYKKLAQDKLSQDRIKSPKSIFKDKKEFVPIFEAYSPKSMKKSPKSSNSPSPNSIDSKRKDSNESNDLSIEDDSKSDEYSSFEEESETDLNHDNMIKQLEEFDKKIEMIELLLGKNKSDDDKFDELEDYEDNENKFIEEVLNKDEFIDDELDPILAKNIEDNITNMIVPLIGESKDKQLIKFGSSKKSKALELEFTKKIIGIINNMVYRRAVSNYGLLLEDDFDLADAITIKKNTISTLEACIDELKKI